MKAWPLTAVTFADVEDTRDAITRVREAIVAWRDLCLALILMAMAGGLVGCDTAREPGDLFAPETEPVVVVDATLLVDQPFPAIFLSRTLSIRGPYSPEAAAVENAVVVVSGADGSADVVTYVESDVPGRYLPADTPPPLVQPETTYRLRVDTPEGEVVTAATRTPPSFSIGAWVLLDETGETILDTLDPFEAPGDTMPYATNVLAYREGLLEARFRRVEVPGYQAGIFSLDPDSDFVIDPDFFDEEDFEDLEREISSPPFEAAGGTLRLPWLAIYFSGRYQIKIYATDRNWYDLVRSNPSLNGDGGGFGGNAGDNFELPIFHIEGGIGLFGSAAVDSVGFRVRTP